MSRNSLCTCSDGLSCHARRSVSHYFIASSRVRILSAFFSALLNLHRPYFAQVLSAAPHDPLKHRYGPSVIAIYRAAWRLIEGLITTHKRTPFIMERLSTPWSQALSAGVSKGIGLAIESRTECRIQIVMCLMVTRAPTSALAPASLHELDRLCEIFEKLQGRSQTAANNLVPNFHS